MLSEVDPDPDLDPERKSKWIRIRPKVVDPDPRLCKFHIYDNMILGNSKKLIVATYFMNILYTKHYDRFVFAGPANCGL